MDIKTQRYLSKIGKEIGSSYYKGVIKKENLYAQREMAERIAVNKSLPKEFRDNVKKKIKAGGYDHIREVVDEKKAREIENAIDYRVRKAIERGDIPNPRKDSDRDKFIKKVWKK